MIDTLQPMLLSEVKQPFDREGWGFEIKFDGYRLLAQGGELGVQLKSRNGADATRWFPEIAQTLGALKGKGIVLDGEVAILDEHGRSDFNKLHERAARRRYVPELPVVYCVFDVLVHGGRSVMHRPLLARKKLLEPLRRLPGILVVDHLEETGSVLFHSAVMPLGLEGMVAKRLDSPYTPGVRSSDWVKVKRPGAVPPERFKR